MKELKGYGHSYTRTTAEDNSAGQAEIAKLPLKYLICLNYLSEKSAKIFILSLHCKTLSLILGIVCVNKLFEKAKKKDIENQIKSWIWKSL